MLRGVWGAALHDLEPEAYRKVFLGGGVDHERVPAYILRPARADPECWPAVEWILTGCGIEFDGALRRAWDVASGMGLGPERRRFFIRRTWVLGPGATDACEGDSDEAPVGWTLDRAGWPLDGDAATRPCRLSFPAPLRLIRRGALIECPTPTDVVVGILRRLGALLPGESSATLRSLRDEVIERSRGIAARPWRGARVDLVRYSGRQERELSLRGVCGYLDLPSGPGELWPLFAAAQWIHLGKGTVIGLGQSVIETIDPRP